MDNDLRTRIAKKIDAVLMEELGSKTPWVVCMSSNKSTCLLSNMNDIKDVTSLTCMTIAYAIGGVSDHVIINRDPQQVPQ